MRQSNQRLLICIICSIAVVVPVKSIKAESLDEMELYARKYDARYLAAQAECGAKKSLYDQARAKYLPTINLNGDANRNNLAIHYCEPWLKNYGNAYNSYSLSAEFIQPILDMGSWEGINQARETCNQAFYALRQAEIDLSTRLSQAYYEVLLAKETTQTLEVEKQSLAEQWRSAQAMHESGVVAITEPLQVKARLLSVEADLIEAKWDLANKRQVLETIVGPTPGDPDPIKTMGVDPPRGTLRDWLYSISRNAQILAAQSALETAKWEELNAYSEFWPTIEVVGRYADITGPSASILTAKEQRDGSIGLRCTWSIFTGWSTLAKCREAFKNKEKARFELAALEREITIEIAKDYSGVCSGIERINALQEEVSACGTVVQAMEEGYSAGARTLVQVLDSREKWLEAKQKYSQAFYDLLMNKRKLQLAVNEVEE